VRLDCFLIPPPAAQAQSRRSGNGVIGFDASGKIAAEDYRDVVLPALEQAARTGDVRFLVTDIRWMSHLTDLFGWLTPGETKTFPLDQRDQAIKMGERVARRLFGARGRRHRRETRPERFDIDRSCPATG
jgi:hypothetical protein